jgi:hypothetical protein
MIVFWAIMVGVTIAGLGIFIHLGWIKIKDARSQPAPDLAAQSRLDAPPMLGETWYFDYEDGSPWPATRTHSVKILDVYQGWVRYKIGSAAFSDERKRVKDFMALYKRTNI